MVVPATGGGGPGASSQPKPKPTTKKTTPTPKKSSSPSINLYKQPLFDNRIRTLAFPMQGGVPDDNGTELTQLFRGWMVWDQASPYSSPPEVSFLFNPTTVTTSYDMDASDVASTLLFNTGQNTAQAAFAMNQSVNLSLYFDRTFELWGSYMPGGSGYTAGIPRAKPTSLNPGANTPNSYNVMDPTVYGVGVDILAFKQLTGQLLQQYTIVGANLGSNAAQTPSGSGYVPGLSQQGVFTMIPTWLFIGSDSGGSMAYYGYVSDFTVTITHFTQYMVPMRCIVDLDFALMMPPSNEPNGPTWSDWMVTQEIQSDVATQSKNSKAGR
jgi:hypothetical protein